MRKLKDWLAARSKLAKQVMAVIASIGIVLGVVVSVLTIIDLLDGDPEPEEPKSPIGGSIAAEIPHRSNVTLEEYLRQQRRPTDDYDSAQLGQIGNVFSVQVTIRGFEGQRLALRWTMEDVDAGKDLQEDAYRDQLCRVFVPAGPVHSGGAPIWVPLPPRAGNFRVRFTLSDPTEHFLDDQTTGSFEVI